LHQLTLGEYDDFFVALLKQRCHQDGLDPSKLGDYFRAHVDRGVSLLQARVKGVADLPSLIPNLKNS
jgi:DNA sulfur modification protein DndE